MHHTIGSSQEVIFEITSHVKNTRKEIYMWIKKKRKKRGRLKECDHRHSLVGLQKRGYGTSIIGKDGKRIVKFVQQKIKLHVTSVIQH